ncbi:unnamed protein product [Nezara viridula]|uniref:Uncharacterized protein n=1 Tax=Nezara viridula TaxID=85310 RepID=A0A9P0HQZ0_NEZVI|nr:unnamed protein product [Nezara viridula]
MSGSMRHLSTAAGIDPVTDDMPERFAPNGACQIKCSGFLRSKWTGLIRSADAWGNDVKAKRGYNANCLRLTFIRY